MTRLTWLNNLLYQPAPPVHEAPPAVLELPVATWNALPAEVRRGLEWVALRSWSDGERVCVEVPGYRAAEFWERVERG